MDLRDLKVALLGSCGGAGLALAYTCAMQRCERLTLAGRSEEKLQELKNRLSSFSLTNTGWKGPPTAWRPTRTIRPVSMPPWRKRT